MNGIDQSKSNEDSGALILAVDDRPANLVALKIALQDVDADVMTTTSGEEALSLLLKHEFAAVLLDVQMPVMDGFETASLIRSNKLTSKLPIIFVTAINKDDEYVFKGYDIGAVDYLFKPINPTILRAKLNVFLDLYRQKRELEVSQANTTAYADALRHSNKELEQFAYAASHDLLEPLRMVSVYCQMLEESCGEKLDEDEHRYIQYAVEGAFRMRVLISDLLSISRINTSGTQSTSTSTERSIEAALVNLELAIKEADASVTHDALPPVMADECHLTQLFQNLIGNAIKYRSQDRTCSVHISAQDENDHWLFRVQDNGIGIDDEYSSTVFEIFRRLHTRSEYSGTGVGLAICKKIVNRLSGKIWVESEPSVGSTFCFTLMKAQCDPEAVAGEKKGESDQSVNFESSKESHLYAQTSICAH